MTISDAPLYWSSNSKFLLATIGMAVGLGNIWRFPYVAGTNGGGAFVLIYLLTLFAFAVPVMIAEFLMGREGGSDPMLSMKKLTAEHKTSKFWMLIGWFSVLIPFVGLCYYAVVAGWTIDYTWLAISGQLSTVTAENAATVFQHTSQNPWRTTGFFIIFLTLTAAVIIRGLHKGIEQVLGILMPVLLMLLSGIAIWAAITGDIQATMQYLFVPDFSKINGEVILAALGQAFFSISAAAGGGMAYAAFLPKQISVPKAILHVGIADTLVAFIAGLAIFPFVFAFDLAPSAGPGLIFQTLPVAFAQLPGGQLLATLFFALLIGAALSTSIAMLNCGVRYLMGRFNCSLKQATLWATSASVFVGLGAALSFGVLSEVKPLAFIPVFADKTLFYLMDYLVAHLMLPMNALLIVLFCGWAIKKRVIEQWFQSSDPLIFSLWFNIVKYLAPLVLLLVFLFGI